MVPKGFFVQNSRYSAVREASNRVSNSIREPCFYLSVWRRILKPRFLRAFCLSIPYFFCVVTHLFIHNAAPFFLPQQPALKCYRLPFDRSSPGVLPSGTLEIAKKGSPCLLNPR